MSYKVSMSYAQLINSLTWAFDGKNIHYFWEFKEKGKKKSISAHFITTLRCSHREIKLYSGKIEIWGLPIFSPKTVRMV